MGDVVDVVEEARVWGSVIEVTKVFYRRVEEHDDSLEILGVEDGARIFTVYPSQGRIDLYNSLHFGRVHNLAELYWHRTDPHRKFRVNQVRN